ncbi:hypothetical protein AURDEDRAFT_178770, partial [Auricularia subglabra TFB-10046 SS5]
MRPKSPDPTGASTSATQQIDDEVFDSFFPIGGGGTPPREQTPPPKPSQRAKSPTSHASPPGPSPRVVDLAVQDANAPPGSDANAAALVVALSREGKTSVSDKPATDAGTPGGETVAEDKAPKRKEAPVGEEKPAKKTRGSTLKAALATMPDPKKFKGVKIRLTSFHEPEVDLPSWWPAKFAWPEEVSSAVDTTRARELDLAVCEMPVPAL